MTAWNPIHHNITWANLRLVTGDSAGDGICVCQDAENIIATIVRCLPTASWFCRRTLNNSPPRFLINAVEEVICFIAEYNLSWVNSPNTIFELHDAKYLTDNTSRSPQREGLLEAVWNSAPKHENIQVHRLQRKTWFPFQWTY